MGVTGELPPPVRGRLPGPAVLTHLDATAARRWAVLSRAALAAHRREIDALNVFPVPDGDTGTNLFLTLDAAMGAARDHAAMADTPTGLAEAADALAGATLLAARGNSGVILSQIVRGLAQVVSAEGGALDGPGLARALRRASELASASVTRPAPGTILSVASDAADAASRAASSPDPVDASLYAVSRAALASAREALARTTEELPELSAAGVVDAGAMGYVLLLEALDSVVSGAGMEPRRASPSDGGDARDRGAAATGARDTRAGDTGARDTGTLAAIDAQRAGRGGPGPGGPAYEVMFLLADGSERSASQLLAVLSDLGDSVVVAGGAGGDGAGEPGLWHVHAHVQDIGAAIEAGVRAGRPHQIRVTPLTDSGGPLRRPPSSGTPDTVGVVAWATGAGLARLFTQAGAGLVEAAPGGRPSAGEILSAVEAAASSCVLVLPNDEDVRRAAEAVVEIAADRGVDVRVVRSRAVVQGIAAMAVFDRSAGWQDNLVAMTSAAAATRHGAVTTAAREALTTAGWCHEGDVLGMVDDDVVTIGADLAAVGGFVVDRLLGSGGEILTVVAGSEAPHGLAEAVGTAARSRRRDIELSVLDGGQPVHHLLLGVE